MIATDENALICDLAEIYHLYNYKSLPATLVATLSVGLRDDSRIKMKMSGAKAPHDIILLSIVVDEIRALKWMLSDDGHKGINKPPSLLAMIYGEEITESKSDVMTFSSPKEYEEAKQKILGKR